MKNDEVKTGETYLFAKTFVEHRKEMIGSLVTVVGRKRGKKQVNIQGGVHTGVGKGIVKFKLSNGKYANASELSTIK